ncbi:hypothetical protein BALOs_2740 [Halobacteriovorax sp. BALOs_7]|uniref:potassium channel family protein n=1 Tax=Halobacteriovorax sp. BALOs_7 TaxID=2109558 RepID=UPI000EA2E2EF|nr:potassium channel family protein [Halobacteriovorax sp. BALOs_7]AYF45730.1 hypothetical protein BALOs_2740 [Halobacteriovorax sp. BALOs_7]
MKYLRNELATTFIITLFLTFLYYAQINYFAEKYHNEYLSDNSGFIISDKIIENKKKYYERKITELTNKIINKEKDFKDDVATNRLLSNYKLALDTKDPNLLNNLDTNLPNDFILTMKKSVTGEVKIQGRNNLDALIEIAKQSVNESKKSLTELSLDFSKYTRKTKNTLLERADFNYFSVVTSTTTGYGDITPLTNRVRDLIKHQTILSLILIGLIISSTSNLMSIFIKRISVT